MSVTEKPFYQYLSDLSSSQLENNLRVAEMGEDSSSAEGTQLALLLRQEVIRRLEPQIQLDLAVPQSSAV